MTRALLLISIAALLAACDTGPPPGPSAADEARAKNAEAARTLREKMSTVKAPELPAADAGLADAVRRLPESP